VRHQATNLALIRTSTPNLHLYTPLKQALRISMEEERARQETSNPPEKSTAAMTEEDMLAQALAMSMAEVPRTYTGR
jgi:Ubiquitin interaction motif